jgi:hypothetical protein
MSSSSECGAITNNTSIGAGCSFNFMAVATLPGRLVRFRFIGVDSTIQARYVVHAP